MQFLHNTGAKFVHWADLGWARRYTPEDWTLITNHIDAVHSTDWGSDIIFECGVMEAIGREEIDSTRIPDWLLRILSDLVVQDHRVAGPNGKEFFNYDAMFDRQSEEWKDLIGLWNIESSHERSVPDITMLETQLYFAYLIAEYIDAGFEGVTFGQPMLTGRRDKDNSALDSLCSFAKRWAAARAYRRAVTLTSHVYANTDYPKSPAKGAKPLFTHLTWPTRMSYTPRDATGMQFGPDAKTEPRRQGGAEIVGLLKINYDLPILLEIDNYIRINGPSQVCDEGYDEITAYANKNPEQRAAFLRKYYFECRTWKNRDGNARVHFALPGYRCLNTPISLFTQEDGKRSAPMGSYLSFKEDGGEEETIKALFQKARTPLELNTKEEMSNY